MSHVNTSYKLGAAQAVSEFTAWAQDNNDNPTAAPPKMASVFRVLKEALDKTARSASCGSGARKPLSRRATQKNSRFSSLKKKLARKKKKAR